MHTVTLNTEEAPNKFWAYRDARMRNYANSTLYDSATKIRAERMKLVLEMLYAARAVYIAYGKRGVSLKVDRASVRDRRELAAMEAQWASEGTVKRVSAQGVIYRFV
jgi:allophanate hydrolase subunit 1